MLSAPLADKAWKAMTRSFPHQERSDQCPAEAGATAYATLLRGPQAAAEDGPRAEPWLLLRARSGGR